MASPTKCQVIGYAVLGFFGVLTVVLLGVLLTTKLAHNTTDNTITRLTNQCGVPDSYCNITNVGGLTIIPNYGDIPCPFESVVDRIIPTTSFNFTICNQYHTYLSLTFYINLTASTANGFIQDNTTLATRIAFPLYVRAVLPGSLYVSVNFSTTPSGLYGTVTVNDLTNLTMTQAENVLHALQTVSYLYYSDVPVVLTGWNSTYNSGNTVATNPVCTWSPTVCPSDQTCMNWLNNAVCMCNFPHSVRSPQTKYCTDNPCYPLNGGCTQIQTCTVNFGATLNRTCT